MSAPASNRPGFEQERLELQRVLASGIFGRAPTLARLLSYVCERHFAGEADQIKEYNIAVEALSRGLDFDQKRDAIVRVEAHRLRKRLKEYYETEGAEHPIHIIIPQGHYTPEFHARPGGPVALENAETTGELSPPSVPPDGAGARWPLQRALIALGAFALVVLIAAVAWSRWKSGSAGLEAAVTKPSPALPLAVIEGDEVRILAGSTLPKYVDSLGRTWLGDRFFKGGRPVSTPDERILQTADPTIFRVRREGDFSYDIPVGPGVYELRLYFAETMFGAGNIAGGAETSRLFNVSLNGQPLLTEFDIIADAGGGSVANIRVFKDVSPGADGLLRLRFTGFKEPAILSGIEIVPGTPGRMWPVRIQVGATPITDSQGRVWEPDRYFSGGQVVERSKRVWGTSDPRLYASERFGNFSYVIPVAQGGRYTLTLKFAETWFGPSKPSGGGVGARVFDVYCNGVALLRNFDILKEAGEDRALDKTFRGLQANAQGKLHISFVPVKNYACVNAIEVVEAK